MNIRQHKFVTEYLKWGDQVIAYKNAYKSKASYKTLQSAANRLMHHPEVATAIEEAEIRIRMDVERNVADRLIKDVFTIEEKRALLKQIAMRTLYVEQHYKGKNCSQCTHYGSSTINHVLHSLKDDSKLAGHYPYKEKGKWVIPALEEQKRKLSTPPQPATGNTPATDPAPTGDVVNAKPQVDSLQEETFQEEKFATTENLQQNTTISPESQAGKALQPTTIARHTLPSRIFRNKRAPKQHPKRPAMHKKEPIAIGMRE